MKTIIVEDEEKSRLTLANMLNNYCEGVEIIDSVDSIAKAVISIKKNKPDFIFLDIEFPGENGFSIFEHFPDPDFEIVFTTAYDTYALQALKMSAVDYLLKPIDLEDLQAAIIKVQDKKNIEASKFRVSILKGNINNQFQKLALPTNDGFSFVELNDILRCEAEGNYTLFHMNNASKIVVCRTLKTYHDILTDFNFFRISRSQLINLKYIKNFTRKRNSTVTMTDGSILSVSFGRKDEFLSSIDNFI
ncbi:MAG: LytR/AlgR family response regulator transcription factor [Saprospiraceae bacterium]